MKICILNENILENNLDTDLRNKTLMKSERTTMKKHIATELFPWFSSILAYLIQLQFRALFSNSMEQQNMKQRKLKLV